MKDPRPDTQYRQAIMPVQLFYQSQAINSFNYAFKDIKFKTIQQYRTANDLLSNAKNIGTYLESINNQYTYSSTPNNMASETYVQDSAREIFKQQGQLYNENQAEFTQNQAKNEFVQALQKVNRISANVVDSKNRVWGYDKFLENWSLQKDIVFEETNLYLDEVWLAHSLQNLGFNQDTFIRPFKDMPDIDEVLVHKTLAWLFEWYNYLPGFTRAIEGIVNIQQQQVEGLEDQYEQLFDWHDVFTNPIGAIARVMGGLTSFLTMFYSTSSALITAGIKIAEPIIINTFTDKRKGEDQTEEQLLAGLLAGIGKMLVSVVSGILNMVLSVMTSTVTTLVTMTKSVLTILKRIQETSQVLKTILSYLELQCDLFFLPFMIQFGEPLLEQLMAFMAIAIKTGITLGNQLQETIQTITDSNGDWGTIYENIKSILVNIIEKLIPTCIPLIVPLLEFINNFTDTIINNSGMIDSLLKNGIEAYTQLMSGGLIKIFLSNGKDFFDFMIDFKDILVGTISSVFNVQRQMFGFINLVMDNLKAFIYVVLGIFGALQGAQGGYRAQTIAQQLTLGIGQISIPQQIAQGQQAGIITGELLQHQIITKFINPVQIPNLTDIVPKFSEGGKIKHKGHGIFGIMGEALQGEYAIPQSKLNLFRGNNNVVIRVNGGVYQKDNIDRCLRELQLEEQINIG